MQKRDKLDGAWSTRQGAYDKLMPLVWHQIITQCEQFHFILALWSRLDIGGVLECETSKDTQLSGWLSVRTHEINDDCVGEWKDRFCVVRNNTFFTYVDEKVNEALPDEIVCLQFAHISANRDFTNAFNMSTPVIALVCRAPNEAALEKWTNGIFALQCSDSFHDLVPNGMQKQHLLRRLRGRGGEMAVRLLKRAHPRSHETTQYLKMKDTVAPSLAVDHDTIELADILKDPKLGSMLKSFAHERGATNDLKLVSEFNEVLGVESERLEATEVDELPNSDKQQLLRISKTHLESSSDAPLDNLQVASVSDAYNEASKRLIGELLPQFCESEGFKTWVAQQHEDEKAELQLITFLQSTPGLKTMREQVSGQKEQHVLAAATRIEELLVSSSDAVPMLPLAQTIVASYFTTGPETVMLSDADLQDILVRAVNTWASDGTVRRDALSTFKRVLIDGLYSQLRAPLNKIISRDGIFAVLTSLVEHEHAKTNLVHWIHDPAAFNVLRGWLSERRAVESIDFIADVVHFTALEDVSITKESANRIYSKFIAPGAIAQICLPSEMVQNIEQGLQPRFPSSNLYDGALEHTIKFIQQETWETFKETAVYVSEEPNVRASLAVKSPKPMLLSARGIGCLVRHAVVLSKHIVTIGTSNCDVCIPEAGGSFTTVLRIDLENDASGMNISVLSHAAPRRARLSTEMASASREKSSSIIMMRNKAVKVKFGESFVIGDSELVILAL